MRVVALSLMLCAAGCYDDSLLQPHDLAEPADLATAPADLACGCLCVTSAPTANAVNLTADGVTDWVHFGATMAPTPPTEPDDRKTGGSAIGALTYAGGATDLIAYPNNGVPFSWTDGTPMATSPAGGSFTGILMNGAGDVLSGSIAATATMQTARVYVDSFVVRGRFEAWLDDGGTMVSPVYGEDVDNSDGTPGGTTRTIAVRYCAPSAGVQLSWRWTLAAVHTCPAADPSCGYNAALQAVALAP